MHRRPQYFAISFVLLLGLILVSLPGPFSNRLKLAIGGLYLPLFGLAGSAQGLMDHTSNSLRSRRDLLDEIERLRRDNQRLSILSAQSQQLTEENNRLRDAVGWQKQSPWKVRLARVDARDPSNWWRTLLIDQGRNHGMVENLPIVSADGFLVGRIESVGARQSRVVLVGDPNCQVAASIESLTAGGARAGRGASAVRDGIVTEGSGPTVVSLSFVDRESDARPGQLVLTNGKGGIFPPGIPIGHVASVRSVSDGLLLLASIKLGAVLGSLEEVFVILP